MENEGTSSPVSNGVGKNGGLEPNVNIMKPGQYNRDLQIWASQLRGFVKPNAVIVGVIVNNNLKKINLITIVNHLKAINVYDQTSEVHYLPNPQFILITFEDEQSPLKFKELSYQIDNMKTVFITGEENRGFCNIFINSLPLSVIQELVVPIIENFGKVIKIVPMTMPRKNGLKCNVGQIKINMLLNDTCTVDSIPYFIRILNCRVFLHIPGKAKICFRCGESDHLVKVCPKAFCPLCRASKLKSHICEMSYASAAKSMLSGVADAGVAVLEDKMLVELSDDHVGALASSVCSGRDVGIASECLGGDGFPLQMRIEGIGGKQDIVHTDKIMNVDVREDGSEVVPCASSLDSSLSELEDGCAGGSEQPIVSKKPVGVVVKRKRKFGSKQIKKRPNDGNVKPSRNSQGMGDKSPCTPIDSGSGDTKGGGKSGPKLVRMEDISIIELSK